MSMSIEEVGRVLARVQVLDGRQIGATTITAWTDVLGPIRWLTYDDAVDAVTAHFRETSDWLKPAHIVTGARQIVEKREKWQRNVERIASDLRAITDGKGDEAPEEWRLTPAQRLARLREHQPELVAAAEAHASSDTTFQYLLPEDFTKRAVRL